MKNTLLFLLACLFSAIAILSSTKISDPELGYATAAMVWGFYAWFAFSKRSRAGTTS